MDDNETTAPATQDTANADDLAQARAGYARRKAKATAAEPAAAAPASAADVQHAAPPSEETTSAAATASDPEPVPTDEPSPSTEPAPPSENAQLRSQVEDLKAHVRQLQETGADKETVRKMHGEIGEINRSLKQLLSAKPADAPAAEDRLAAALEKARATAKEYGESTDGFLEAIELLAARIPGKEAPPAGETDPPPPADEKATAAPAAPQVDLEAERQLAAQKAARANLLEIHSDYFEVRKSAAFNKWFETWRTPADRERAKASWNPAVVAQPVTDFKAHLAAQKRNKDRLDAAVQPQGTAGRAQPTTPTDADLARRGYQRYSRRG